jgi:signal peptidase I
VFVDMHAYGVREPFWGVELFPTRAPRRGDVVMFRSPLDPEDMLVQRVVALPGDRIEIRDKRVLLNGVETAESYVTTSSELSPGQRDQMPVTEVPQGKFFAMGDNRDRSYDSRFWGFAALDDIVGRAAWVYWSRDGETGDIRWGSIGGSIE